jgi:predicted HTH transcriptional regulator
MEGQKSLESLLEEIRNEPHEEEITESFEEEERKIVRLIIEARSRKECTIKVSTLSKEMKKKLLNLNCEYYAKTVLPIHPSYARGAFIVGYIIKFL